MWRAPIVFWSTNSCPTDLLIDSCLAEKLLDWKTRYSIALDTARGLAYLHDESRRCVLHLDVKPQNILLDENFKAKVSDFGMARSDLQSLVVTQVRGTPEYMAPEWLSESGITSKTDVSATEWCFWK